MSCCSCFSGLGKAASKPAAAPAPKQADVKAALLPAAAAQEGLETSLPPASAIEAAAVQAPPAQQAPPSVLTDVALGSEGGSPASQAISSSSPVRLGQDNGLGSPTPYSPGQYSSMSSRYGSPDSPQAWEGQFAANERATYNQLFPCATSMHRAQEVLQRSGLPVQAIRAVWQVANPNARALPDKRTLWMCCRLVGHCQAAVAKMAPGPALLEDGGPALERLLGSCAEAAPPVLLSLVHGAAPTNWTEGERAAYGRFYKEVGTASQQVLVTFFQRSALPEPALTQIFEVSKVEQMTLSTEQFWLCCRLVGHCQAMQRDSGSMQLLQDGGVPLGSLLNCRHLLRPPPRLPDFRPDGTTTSPTHGRVAAKAPPSPTANATEWSQGERAAYTRLFSEYEALAPTAAVVFFERAGLPQNALDMVKQAASPFANTILTQEEFWTTCRLVGHCQGMQAQAKRQELLEAGGAELEALLKERCLGRLPPQLPDFRRRRGSAAAAAGR